MPSLQWPVAVCEAMQHSKTEPHLLKDVMELFLREQDVYQSEQAIHLFPSPWDKIKPAHAAWLSEASDEMPGVVSNLPLKRFLHSHSLVQDNLSLWFVTI